MLLYIPLLLTCVSPFLSSNKAGENTTVGLDTCLAALYIPLQKVVITVRDETRSLHLPDINEAFLIEVANALSQYEVSRRCKVMPIPVSEDHDSASVIAEDFLLKTFGSKMPAESGSIEKISAAIRSIASQYSVDLIILPLKASVTETLSKQKGWRQDKYGRSYQRPITCVAEASISLQIWDRKGNLLFKNTGKGMTKQPLFYSLLKREKPEKEDLVHFSKNVFAPPLIRALSSAVKEMFPKRQASSKRGWRS